MGRAGNNNSHSDLHRRTQSGSLGLTGNPAESIGSGDDDDTTPRRATRSKVGPLPPNGPTNPLFPPLPPKIPRPRKTASANGSVGSLTPGGSGNTNLPTTSTDNAAEATDEDKIEQTTPGHDQSKEEDGMQVEIEATAMDVDPPATATDAEENQAEDNKVGFPPEEGSDEWDSYARQHKARGFSAAAGALTKSNVDPASASESVKVASENPHVKEEPGMEEQPSEERGATKSSSPSLTESLSSGGHIEPRSERKSTRRSSMQAGTSTKRSGSGSGSGRSGKATKQEGKEKEDVAEDDDVDRGDVTRCVCEKDDIDVMMIQCDMCNAWQHGACVGVWGDDEAPDEYFCDVCRPGLHIPLKRLFKARSRRGEGFSPPTPADLQQYHYNSDRIKPSQSKRWTNPAIYKQPYVSPGASAAPNSKGSTATGEKRSHHRKKETSPPVSAASGESRRVRGARGASSAHDGPASKDQVIDPPSVPHSKRKGSMQHHRRASSTLSDTPPTGHAPPARKRNTMNSRDSAYDDAIAASLLDAGVSTRELQDEKRRREQDHERGHDDEAVLDDDHDRKVGGVKRRRAEEEDLDRDEDGGAGKKMKRRKEDDAHDPNAPKAKHPNQYTYRPKVAGTPDASPTLAKATVASPVKKAATAAAAAAAESSARKNTALKEARGTTPATSSKADTPAAQGGSTIGPFSWALPDHLSTFTHLLPEHPPAALELRTPRPFNAKQLAKDPATIVKFETQLEPPHKVRYPTKRMTVGEMKKRVRSVLEYVGRIQVEETKRNERAKLLGIEIFEHFKEEVVGVPEAAIEAALASAVTQPVSTAIPAASRSIQLMDELTRDLIKFQELFELGMGAAATSAAAASSVSQQTVDAPSANGATDIEAV